MAKHNGKIQSERGTVGALRQRLTYNVTLWQHLYTQLPLYRIDKLLTIFYMLPRYLTTLSVHCQLRHACCN